MLVGWQGNSYVEGLVSEAECSKKLQELKSGMTKAFEYSQGKEIKFYSCICIYVQMLQKGFSRACTVNW